MTSVLGACGSPVLPLSCKKAAELAWREEDRQRVEELRRWWEARSRPCSTPMEELVVDREAVIAARVIAIFAVPPGDITAVEAIGLLYN